MDYGFLVFLVFILGGWFIGWCLVKIFFPKKKSGDGHTFDQDGPGITINNYTTENHLHITDQQLKKLLKK